MIRAVVRSPFTEPSFLISMRSFARRFPFTVPYTTTSRALMSAVSFAVFPTVSFRSSSWISPSTEPSISRSSVPMISPFTCRLDPSHPVAWSAVESNGRIASVLSLFVSKFFGSGAVARGVSGFFLSHIRPPLELHTPRRFPAEVHQTQSYAPAYRNSLRVSAAYVTRSFFSAHKGCEQRAAAVPWFRSSRFAFDLHSRFMLTLRRTIPGGFMGVHDLPKKWRERAWQCELARVR